MKCEICDRHFLLKSDMAAKGLCNECFEENPENLFKVATMQARGVANE